MGPRGSESDLRSLEGGLSVHGGVQEFAAPPSEAGRVYLPGYKGKLIP